MDYNNHRKDMPRGFVVSGKDSDSSLQTAMIWLTAFILSGISAVIIFKWLM